MTRKLLFALKSLAWIACLWPLAHLVWGAVNNSLGPDPSAQLARSTGSTALLLLSLSLAITPLRLLSRRLAVLIRFRRLLGLFAFFYATLHLLLYAALYAGFDTAALAADLTNRRFILAGFATWLLLLPLAATSTAWAIRKLGGARWRWLHRLAYLAAIGALVHYWWLVKPGVLAPLGFTLPLALLLMARLLPSRRSANSPTPRQRL